MGAFKLAWIAGVSVVVLLPSCGSGRMSPPDCGAKGSCGNAQDAAARNIKLSWKQKDFASLGAVLFRLPRKANDAASVPVKLFEIKSSTTGVKITGDGVTLVLPAAEIPDLKVGDCFELKAVSAAGVLSPSSDPSCL